MMIAALPLVASAISAAGGPSATSVVKNAMTGAVSGASDSFSSMLASFSQDTVDKMKTSEQMSIGGITGKASTQSVVEAVMSAQESLSTALAVRDKAVSAFQDISRMPI